MAETAPRFCTLHVFARHGTTEREALLAVIDSFDAAAYLRDAGLRDDEMQAVRSRLR
ncbi:hypothetical protein [Actinoallomurus soli]|uniref:hypothetical protein n=1 Tax=Actinoallomurus soli TaxID=2952535 RepID=UPI0020936F51|nr:hypothetical protein [Actinoallomurus soli]MCO5969454.1 hypothetical protein [Actinoallomurus soli]